MTHYVNKFRVADIRDARYIHLMTKTTYPEPTLAEVMYDEAWTVLSQLADRYLSDTAKFAPARRRTRRAKASRTASTLYSLGLCTNPDKDNWVITPAGVEALRARAVKP